MYSDRKWRWESPGAVDGGATRQTVKTRQHSTDWSDSSVFSPIAETTAAPWTKTLNQDQEERAADSSQNKLLPFGLNIGNKLLNAERGEKHL